MREASDGGSFNVVVIGDVSQGGKYHLGDEAMTEVAIAELRRRGGAVTLIAGDPVVSSDLYEVTAVPRFGFIDLPSREERLRLLEDLRSFAHEPEALPEQVRATLEAVRRADAIVVAGGGNLNSSSTHHLFERLALKRLAEQAGIPLFVSSQTVGPHLRPEDRELIREIAGYAEMFGVRERHTAALMRELCEGEGEIVLTSDDAVLLEPSLSVEQARERFAIDGRYVIGSFTYHTWSTGLTRGEYYRRVARILDDLVELHDVEVLLIAHMGSLEQPSAQIDDIKGHERIAEYSTSGRVRAVAMDSARAVLSITAGAEFTISTRYHPVVFGFALGVPAVGLVTSYYSAIRMRGALVQAGLESLAIPFEHWSNVFGERLGRVLKHEREGLAAYLREASTRVRTAQNGWWDVVVARIRGDASASPAGVEPFEPFEWGSEDERVMLELARAAQEPLNLYRLNRSLSDKDRAAEERALRRRVERLERAQKEAQKQLAELRHRMRPPGADLRDRIRLKLRSLRER